MTYMAALYVGDLHPDVTEAMLYEKFSTVGPLLSLRVCRDNATRRSLGYAYVNFQTPCDAENALDTMNFDLIKGKPIRIMWSQRDPSLRKSGVGNVFVKNLHKDIDNKGLYDTFSIFGNILSCKVVMDDNGYSKGYGFIHFETEEGATKAIVKVNGMLINDKKVYVGKFIPQKERCKMLGSMPKIFTNIYIKNMPEMTEPKLYELFGGYGNITSCVVMKNADGSSRGFGFVAFDNPVAAEKALTELHDKDVDGHKLYVAKAQKKSERLVELRKKYDEVKTERYSRLQGVNLFIKNLDDVVDDTRLLAEFGQFGAITSAKVMMEDGRSKGFGFVCFSTPDEANKAMNELHGKMLGNKPIFVAMAQRKEDRKAIIAAHLQRIRIQPNLYPTNPPFLIPAVAQGHRFYNVNHLRTAPRWLANPPIRSNGAFPPLANNVYRVSSRTSGQINQRASISARPITGQAIHSRPNSKYTASNNHLIRPVSVSLGNGGDNLTASTLASASPEDQKQMIGAKLFPHVEKMYPEMAGKITGMLLEIEPCELIHMIEDQESLRAKVEEAIAVLQAHQDQSPQQMIQKKVAIAQE